MYMVCPTTTDTAVLQLPNLRLRKSMKDKVDKWKEPEPNLLVDRFSPIDTIGKFSPLSAQQFGSQIEINIRNHQFTHQCADGKFHMVIPLDEKI